MFNYFNSTKKIPIVSLSLFNLIFAIWFALALNFGFYQKLLKLTPYHGLSAALFIIASSIVIIALYNLIFQIIHWKFNAKIFILIWIVLGGLSAYFVNSLGVIITSDQIQNMLQTDTREAFDLLTAKLIVWSLIFVLLPLLVVYFLPIKTEKIQTSLIKKLIHSFASLIVIGSLLFIYYVDYAAIFREHRDLKGMISPQNVVASSLSYYKKQAPKKNLPLVRYGEDAQQVKNTTHASQPKLMVLVVGETARAESFSLNGYAKNTNPELSKLDLINFKQVSSCGTATAVSVPCMFSGMTRQDYDATLASHREGLLDIAQRAGYKVTWIDNNSGCKGVCNRVEQYQFPTELKNKWCSADGECQDEILVDSLKAYIQSLAPNDNTSHLIVLHQMGSHGPAYYKRSTAAFQPFKPFCDTNAIQGCSSLELLNSYDNSIVYTDHVLSSMIDHLAELKQYQTGFWYLSDHGESTGEHGMYLHGSPYAIAPSQQTHIPMFMWFSPTWKTQHTNQINCLTQQQNNVLSQDNLFPTLLNLLDIQSKTIDNRLNLLGQCQSTD